MRQIVESDLPAFLDWLGVHVEGTARVLPGAFTAETKYVDLLVQIGPSRLLHVEYVHTPEGDLPLRMLGYRAAVMAAHEGKRLTQYAIVLKDGVTQSCDDPANGFTLGYRTLYLRESPPEPLRRGIGLSALASLAAGDTDTRAAGLSSAYTLIQTLPQKQAEALRDAAAVLATIRLDPHTIDQIRKESGMTVETIADFYSQTEVGRELINRGDARMLDALIRDRFGDRPEIPKIAERLAREVEPVTAVHTITRATSFEDLLASRTG